MKKILFLFLACQFLNSAQAQFQFAPLGAKWYYENICDGQTQFFASFEVSEDTVIQGKYCTLVDYSNCNAGLIPAYVYNEGDTVFHFDQESNNFQVLYDFSKQPGESWRIKVCPEVYETDTLTIRIDSVKISNIDGYPIQIQYVSIIPDSAMWSAHVIPVLEGIGSRYNRLLYTGDPFITSECGSLLLCYETPDNGVIHLAGTQVCDPNATNDFGDILQDFILFPNPASSKLHIEIQTLEFMPEGFFRIFDHQGRLKYQWLAEPQKRTYEVEFSDWQAGIYFLQLARKDGTMFTKSFVIEP